MGLYENKLRPYVLLQFEEIFTPKMKSPYSLRKIVESTTLFDRKRFGRLIFVVWVIGNDYPMYYYIEAKAGNQLHYFWRRDVLKKGLKEEIPDDIKKVIKEFIQELANDFLRLKSKNRLFCIKKR